MLPPALSSWSFVFMVCIMNPCIMSQFSLDFYMCDIKLFSSSLSACLTFIQLRPSYHLGHLSSVCIVNVWTIPTDTTILLFIHFKFFIKYPWPVNISIKKKSKYMWPHFPHFMTSGIRIFVYCVVSVVSAHSFCHFSIVLISYFVFCPFIYSSFFTNVSP